MRIGIALTVSPERLQQRSRRVLQGLAGVGQFAPGYDGRYDIHDSASPFGSH